MKSLLAALAAVFGIVRDLLRLRIREAQEADALEDGRADAAARIREALARGEIGDAAAAKAEHDAIDAQLRDERPVGRIPSSPKR